jgi:small subunit ribosomal protein S3
MKERLFIQKSREHVRLREFIRRQFAQAKCGDIEIQYTPVVTRIILYTTTPGLIIGSGGERIKETVEVLKKEFGIENPQIDVQKISEPDLDPHIVAQNIAASLESGVNFKKLGNFYLQRVMDSGAVGCEIVITGKLSGQRGRRERFIDGYLKKCGEPSKRDVLKGFALANPKLGNIGVTVKIMIRRPELSIIIPHGKEEIKEEAKVLVEQEPFKEVVEENKDKPNVEEKVEEIIEEAEETAAEEPEGKA